MLKLRILKEMPVAHWMLFHDWRGQEDQDWNFVAMVLDRLFLWMFSIASLVGSVTILMEAPALYDDTRPIDMQISLVAKKIYGETDI